jgi:hypothetical protein
MLSILIFFLNSIFSSSQRILYLFDAANLGCSDSYSVEDTSISIPLFTRESAALRASGKVICKASCIRLGVILPFFTMRRKVLDSLAESFSSEPRIFSILVISTDNKDVYCWKLFFKILI